MGFLIDTNLWIEVERGNLGVADIHALTRQEHVYVSPINLAELRYGIELVTDTRQHQRALAMLRRMRRKPLLKITGKTADVFGMLAAHLTRTGRRSDFRVQDLWLAAQAIEGGHTLLTANPRDFQDIPDLKLVHVPLPR